jgi:hypothetical protein
MMAAYDVMTTARIQLQALIMQAGSTRRPNREAGT